MLLLFFFFLNRNVITIIVISSLKWCYHPQYLGTVFFSDWKIIHIFLGKLVNDTNNSQFWINQATNQNGELPYLQDFEHNVLIDSMEKKKKNLFLEMLFQKFVTKFRNIFSFTENILDFQIARNNTSNNMHGNIHSEDEINVEKQLFSVSLNNKNGNL